MTDAALQRLTARLQSIYAELPDVDCGAVAAQILRLMTAFQEQRSQPVADSERWSQQDIILITYGNSIQNGADVPLQTLAQFLRQHLLDTINAVHLLPFFPYSSDDGFSVIDYRQVNPDWGDWGDIATLARDFDLMMDLVINHCSRENLWFIDFISNREPYTEYFIEVDPGQDVSLVTRPRNTPLLTPVHTHRGRRHVWATFSEDQVDLNFANPLVLLEFIQIFLFYIEQGARFIRLDAIAFLWKKLGTRCLHLPQTHEVVKLLRDVVDLCAPDVIIITETNVPVAENLSYFGRSDEAHMVYQFGLPPLVLHALNRGNADFLTRWAADIPALPKGCTYLNFTASHDGIGVRPVEQILPEREVQDLIDCMHRFGGFVSTKANQDGSESPYEINISLFDACMGTRRGVDHFQVPRFLCAQSMMLSMQGIPAVYLHSLTATPNDIAHVEQTGRTRSINRKLWQLDELEYLLSNPVTPQAEVFNELRRLIQIRRRQPAFHPNACQSVIHINSDVFILQRQCQQQQLFAIANVTERILTLPLAALGFLPSGLVDLIAPQGEAVTEQLKLAPYQVVWLTDAVF
ncbi:alpha-amylase [Bacterioplanes sanyensis]|uniref:Alpha-amylase n=1 Tax=Bacterioplanes sanyensis TaxID=1249553 RepID=A0A222FL24_9GAMM|nr:sugar phosphorylase [Bacterioplanes sanyensis]ASP39480.1 alpha-amylase [Bacterioplanes sanyensis]